MTSLEKVKVVTLGGRAGLSTLRASLKHQSLHEITAIVTVSDDSGSSGRIHNYVDKIKKMGLKVCQPKLFHEKTKVRHHSVKLARAVLGIFEKAKPRKGRK